MPINAQELEQRLINAFPEAKVQVADLTGTGDHYSATVITKAFEDKSLLERHRMVYGALGDSMKGEIHALALTTRTPDEP